jgi:ketosteroid isomerase-like protein
MRPPEQAHEERLRVARHFVTFLGHADIDEALDLLSESASYHVVGEHRLAGTFHGRDEIAGHLAQLAEFTKGTLEAVKWEDWLVGDTHVATIAQVQMQARGQRYTGRQLFLFRFTGEDAVEAVEVFSTDPAGGRRFFWG